MDTIHEGNDSPDVIVQEALRNPLILNQIFKHLSTNFLLSSCSLVSKFWCKESSRFIQKNRKCKVGTNWDRYGSMCNFLRDFDHLMGEMGENKKRRQIPFNGLKIHIINNAERCPTGDSAGDGLLLNENSKTHFSFKYLDLDMSDEHEDCSFHNHPFRELLHQKDNELRILKVRAGARVRYVTMLWEGSGNDLGSLSLPQLEQLDMSELFHVERGVRLEEEREAVEKLLRSAPQLKKVVVGDVGNAKLIPKERLTLLLELGHKLEFRMKLNEDLDVLKIMAAKGSSSNLKQLSIHVPPFDGQHPIKEMYYPEDEIVDQELRQSFDHACKSMLQASRSSLEEIFVEGLLPLGQLLDLPPMTRVTKFKLKKRYEGEVQELWDSVRMINYEKIMPGLKQVEISIQTAWYDSDERRYIVDDDFRDMWPPEDDDAEENNIENAIYGSKTVRELTLGLQLPAINLTPLKSLFPNVSRLHFKVQYTAETRFDIAPLAKIWEYFPQLEKLEITGDGGAVHRNYDADFCGLTDEEVEMLREKTEDYLRKVQIVPIRPAITTMPKLRKLHVTFPTKDMLDWYDHFGSVKEDRADFISNVTRLVAFERIPYVDVHFSGCLEAFHGVDDGAAV